jgi:hypothetical protein
LRRDVPQDAITIGVAAYREENELTLGKLFAMPFREQREWRLPSGDVPERELQPAEKLVE